MSFHKIIDSEITFLSLTIDKNVVIEFIDKYYIYLKLHDFTMIEEYDEKFFDASKFGLYPNLNIYGIYESKDNMQNKTLLIVTRNDILIVKTDHYEIIYRNKKEESEFNNCYIKCNEPNVSNFEISKIRLGTCKKLDVEFEAELNVQDQKFSYMSKNYVEAFKIMKQSDKIENDDFLNDFDKVFPVMDYIKDGYYHYMELDDDNLSLELLFSGVNINVQLYRVECQNYESLG